MQQLTSEMRLTNGSDGSLAGKVLGGKRRQSGGDRPDALEKIFIKYGLVLNIIQ